MPQARPDLLIRATVYEDRGLGASPGVDVLAEAMRNKPAEICEAPVIRVERI